MRTKKPRKQKTDDVIKSSSDAQGNLLICKNNGKRIVVKIKLSNEQRYREVGVINMAQRVMDVKRSRGLHLHNMSNSYGFNHKLLSEAKRFDNVRLKDELGEWLIPREFILENGKFLFFKQQGFELQTFIPLSMIEQFKREPKF